MKSLIIDSRMRQIEKDKLLELNYNLIEIEKEEGVYEEISAHPDIFCCKINNTIILEPQIYDKYFSKLKDVDYNFKRGTEKVGTKYPKDILYNVCSTGKYAIHNFKYTDKAVLDEINKYNIEKIAVMQGYTNCSIAVIDEKSIITADKGIYANLKEYDLDVLLIDKEDIKLLKNNNSYSSMNGFIGGTISRVGDNIIVTGDAHKLNSYSAIKKYLSDRNLNLIDFSGYDLIDYGGIIELC